LKARAVVAFGMDLAIPMPDSLGRFEKRFLGQLTATFEEWSRCRQDLSQWEQENLYVENPSPERLADHKKQVERLIFFGQLFAFVTSHPEFPDTELAEMVHANQWILREMFLTFHDPNPMPQEEVDRLLKEVYTAP